MSPVSCWNLLLLLLAPAAVGAAAMPQPARPKAGPTKRQQQQHNKRAASLGWGFAALANAPYGLLPGYSNTGSTNPPPPQVFSCSGSSSEGETLKNANGKILFSQLGKLCRVRLSCLLFPVDGSK